MNEPVNFSTIDRVGDELAAELDDVVSGQFEREAASMSLPPEAIVSRLIAPDGAVPWSDPRFPDWVGPDVVDMDVCNAVRATGRVRIAHTIDAKGDTLLLIYSPAAAALSWLPLNSQGFKAPAGSIAVAALCLSHLSDRMIRICRAMGMGNLEARVCAALVEDGSIKRAALRCGVTYNTARKAFGDAMKCAGVSRQSQMVRKLYEICTVASPRDELLEPLLVQTFSLSRRDARLALLLAQGHERADAGAIAGMSAATTKDACSRLFTAMGVTKAPEIPRVVLDTLAAALLADTTAPVENDPRVGLDPLRLVRRADNTLVAYNDYGPEDGRPVLILHSSLSTRHPYRKLVRTLQTQGFRPITIDRPGFGLTDDVRDQGDNPFAAGVDDVALVCERAGIARLDLITRGCSHGALALARARPDLVGRVVAINPDLLQPDCTTRKGYTGIIRQAFERFPGRIESIARWLSERLSRRGARHLLDLALCSSEIDIRAFDDPETLEDYERTTMGFATGRLAGFIREQRGYALGFPNPPLSDGSNWTLIIGRDDPVHDVVEIENHWRDLLPGASVVRPARAERYIELTHTQLVVDALAQAPCANTDQV